MLYFFISSSFIFLDMIVIFLFNSFRISSNSFHDRFVIMDKKILYSCGLSFKDLGKKCFAINKIETEIFLEKILETIEV